ncbi:hypothetical protein IWW36_002455 [Coemansia brasiliensis]|uniref:Histone deacetylase interacting domain-containing protein n=1 Tax=Coemansia brasiliensis TaxID=2650707 RepID=A0A9W8I9L6_9FUNG|nr:hypothetical protein IWW36_002455 [Coemansia brasiliensis]
METGDSRTPAKAPPVSAAQQQQQLATAAQRGMSGVPSGAGSSTPTTPMHRYSATNQLPPIQSPMSPKAEPSSASAGMRPYMPPMAQNSPPATSSRLPSAPHSARSAPGYSRGSLSAHSQSSFPGGQTLPPNSSSSGSTPLPPIAGGYGRSPSFTSATATSSIPPIKSQPTQTIPHTTTSPLSAPTTSAATVHEEALAAAAPATFASPTPGQASMQRMHPSSIASPNARPALHSQQPMQSPHQNTASVPPPKQSASSPKLHRAVSAQNTPVPPHAQQSPRQTANPAQVSSAGTAPGATFTTTPKTSLSGGQSSSMATTAVPPLGPGQSMGTVGRPAAVASGPSQAAGLAISGAQNGRSTTAVASNASAPTTNGVSEPTRQPAQADASGRPLNVSDALSYLDMVKSQFQDRPEVYNQFLEIMKDFKSHTIDTPGVIERVSRLFYGSPSLIQGFNTFLPPGYRIECSDDPAEGVRVTTPSGSIIPDMHRRTSGAAAGAGGVRQQSPPAASSAASINGQRGSYTSQQTPTHQSQYATRRSGPGGLPNSQIMSPPPSQAPVASAAPPISSQDAYAGSGQAPIASAASAAAAMDARSPGAMRSPSIGASQRSRQVPVEFNHAITYVNKIKMRFAAEPDRYKEFLEILQTYQKESRPIQEVYAQVQHLFSSAPDLLDEFKQFLPDTSEQGAANMAGLTSPGAAYAHAGSTSGASAMNDAVAGGRLPPVGNFAPAGTAGHGGDSYSGQGSGGQAMGMGYDGKGTTPTSSRKRRGVMGSGSQASGPGSAKRRSKGRGEGESVYGQGVAALQAAANPATATPDELAFFERVKRFIGQPNAYNEFLKLLNLYNQQVLDPKTLVERAESFIGDDRELFGWFKQFVGYDEQQHELDDARSGDEAVVDAVAGPEYGAYVPPEEVAKTLRPPRPKVNLAQCKSYGPSYRLLPDASTQAKCSGRDAMCFEVLNDRWASHPTWASEDTEFVHHKKNQYEEAMFRSEEDRHEMDIEIDTNLSVIRQLTPIAQQIEQMDPEQQANLTLPENFLGMSEALPRRALRKVYDSNRALEIIKAMHTHPATAIPIVLKRLKQKDEEWRRQRREFGKIWRENDSKNYYRALDHQGLTFKSADRKNISPKHLITEIETRRREQQSAAAAAVADDGSGARNLSHKVASALRHRYQLEFQFMEGSVIADVINAILAHVGRQNSQFASSEKEQMERFFHELFGGLMGIESPEFVSLGAGGAGSDSSDDAEKDTPNPTAPASEATNGIPTNGTKSDVDMAEASAPESAMDVDAKPQETALANGTPASPQTDGGSKPSTPGLISSRSWIQIGSAGRDSSLPSSISTSTTKNVSRAFYTNSNYYVFLRLFQILYERFNRLRELGPECQDKVIQAHQAQSVATKLGMRQQVDVLKSYDLERTDYYTIFLELVDQFLQGQLESSSFDEAMRVMYGINAYRILTVDKVVQAISKSLQTLVSDSRCIDILELFSTLPPVHEQSPLRSHIAYRMKVEALVGADEHVFRVDYLYDSQTMTIQLLRREDITLDQAVTEEERWAYYVDSYVLFEPTEGVIHQQHMDRPRPYLRRHLHADECDYAISSRSNLEIKIAVNTYKLCFLTGTEDIYANHSRRAQMQKAKGACDEAWNERALKWREWVHKEHEQHEPEEGANSLEEWWK